MLKPHDLFSGKGKGGGSGGLFSDLINLSLCWPYNNL